MNNFQRHIYMYRRRYRKRYKRRYKPRRKYGTKTLDAKVNWLIKQNKVNRPELRFADTTVANADIYTTPTIDKIEPKSNVGDRMTIKSVQLKGNLELTTTTTGIEHYRVIIFTDKSNEGGTAPTWGDIYKGATGIDAVKSLRFLDEDNNEGQRFRILYDKRFTMINDADAQIRDNIVFDMYKKLNLPSINVNGSWWEKGGLYIAFVGTSATTVADFTYDVRIRYVQKSN